MLHCDDIQYQSAPAEYFQNCNSPNNHNSDPMYHNDYELLSLPEYTATNLYLINLLLSFLKFSDINMTFKDHQSY